jgi:CDP-2,3-bis-(O-geranylgeranyl)-sn-glycerol synthase
MSMFRIAQLAYLMLPVYLANMAAPFARHWSGWNRPISRRWLGAHKTVVGFGLGVATAVAVAFVQYRVRWSGSVISYDHWLVLGLGCGIGALGGDSIKSFIKRQLGITPGQPWIPADQLDFIVGGLAVLSFWARLSWLDVLSILSLSFVGDVVVNHVAYYLRIRDTKW